jgi:hypothetical protein
MAKFKKHPFASVPQEASKASHRPARASAGSMLNAPVSTRCRHRFGVEGTKALQEITPGLLIDGCFLSTTLGGVGASLLRGTMALADVKAKSCDDKYPAERSGSACTVVTKRQQEVNEKYHKKAGLLKLMEISQLQAVLYNRPLRLFAVSLVCAFCFS